MESGWEQERKKKFYVRDCEGMGADTTIRKFEVETENLSLSRIVVIINIVHRRCRVGEDFSAFAQISLYKGENGITRCFFSRRISFKLVQFKIIMAKCSNSD